MHHAVDVAGKADEQAELGDVADLAFEHRARGMTLGERVPGILHALLQAEADAALVGIDFQHHHLDLLAGGDDLVRMNVLLHPAHFGDMHEAFDARLQLHEGAVVGDVGDLALEARADRIFGADAFPGIGLELLHAQADALGFLVHLDDLHGDLLADIEHFGRMRHAPPGDVGDVQETIDAAEIDEGAVVGDVLDRAFEHLAFGERGDQFGPLLGALLFEHGAAGDDDVAAAAIHFQDLEGLRHVHQRADIAHGTDVDLAAGKERDGAVEIDGEAALDAAEDHAGDAAAVLECLLEPGPGLLAPRLVAAEHGFTQSILDPLDIDLDLVADLDVQRHAGRGEFLQRHAAFGLETDIDDDEIVFDARRSCP